MIFIFLSIISIILGLIHLVIYKAIISIFYFSFSSKIYLAYVLVFLCLSFVISSVLSFNFDNFFSRILYKVSAIWLGLAFYLFLFSSVYLLTLFIFQIFNINFSLQIFGIVCFVLAFMVTFYGILHAQNILIKNVNVSLPNLPKAWENKKVLYVSDFHLGAIHKASFAKKVVDKINDINPDIIFIGGDLYDGVKVNVNEIIKPLSNLHPKLGTYFVTGNHEEFRDKNLYLEPIKKIGIHVLDNQILEIEGLQIIGMDEHDSMNKETFKTILKNLNIDKNKTSILLRHEPTGLEDANESGISLQISGHTHKMQAWPLNFLAKKFFKGYDYGLNMYKNMAVFTSSGVGSWGPPIRVGSDSELIVFKFTSL